MALNVTLDEWSLLLGLCLTSLFVLVATLIFQNIIKDAADKAYEEGYASGQADFVLDSIDEIEEFANEGSGFD